MNDPQARWLIGGGVTLLFIATVIGRILKSAHDRRERAEVIANLNARINAWWVMCAVFAAALVVGPIGTVVLALLLHVSAAGDQSALIRHVRMGMHPDSSAYETV